MSRRFNFTKVIILFLMQSILLTFPCSGSISIGGMSFDMAVINNQAASSDYSYSQASSSITINGKRPSSGADVCYYLFHSSQGNETEYMALVDVSSLLTQSTAGFMLHAAQSFTGQTSDMSADWCRLGVTDTGMVFFEKHVAGFQPQRTDLFALLQGSRSVYIKAVIERGLLSFYISNPAETVGNGQPWLHLGDNFAIPFNHSFGFFLEPRGVSSNDRVVFNSPSITERTPSTGIIKNGLAKTGVTTVGITGLGDWAEVVSAANRTKFIDDIKNQYSASGFSDLYQQKLFDRMKTLLTIIPQNATGDESDQIAISMNNAMVYLSDAVNSYISAVARVYPNGTDYKLYLDLDADNKFADAVDILRTCNNAAFHRWYDWINPYKYWNLILGDGIACGGDLLGVLFNKSEYTNLLEDKDAIFQNSAKYIVYLTLLSIIDTDFNSNYSAKITSYIEQVRSLMQKVSPFYNNNNIPMKVFSAIALWDLAHGSTTSSASLNLMLKDKFMDGGGYAEGSGYLGWLNEEFLPYYYIATCNGWLPVNLQLTGVKNSGYWLLDMADQSGFIAPVDDGINETSPTFWLAPYAFINNDNSFKEYESVCVSAPSDPLRFLTYPPLDYPGKRMVAPLNISDGIGKINVKSLIDNADISATMVTENAGSIKVNGGSHDQQDDGSISLRRQLQSTIIGLNSIDNLIIDPGYGGYKFKGTEEYYKNHNTIQINANVPGDTYGGIDPCPFGNGDYFLNIAYKVVGFDFQAVVPKSIHSAILDRKAAGGPGYSEINKVFSNGFESKITFNNSPDYAYRSLVNIGDEFYVIDRINSSTNSYTLHYNMPVGSRRMGGANNVYDGQNGNSKIRLTAFCSDDFDQSVFVDTSYRINEVTDPSYWNKVTSVRFSNLGTHLPSAGQSCAFLSVLEPMDISTSYGNVFSNITANIGDAQILVCKQIGMDIRRYVFVNTVTSGTRGTVRIPAVAGWHAELTTDAEYGVVDFDKTTQNIESGSTKLYAGAFAWYNGTIKVPFDGTSIIQSNIRTKVFGTLSSKCSAKYIEASHKIEISTDKAAQTFGYWQVDADFDYTFTLPSVGNVSNNSYINKPGFMVRTSLNPNDQQFLNAYMIFRTTNQQGGGIDWSQCIVKQGVTVISGPDQILSIIQFRCCRKNDQVTLYYLVDTGWVKLANISINSPFVYIGYTLSEEKTVQFDTLAKYNSSLFSSTAGLGKKSTLSSLGYSTSGKDIAGWQLNTIDGYVYSNPSDSPVDSSNTLKNVIITSPKFIANRDLFGGIDFEWKAQFPTWYYDQNFSKNNTLTIDFVTTDTNNKYSLIFIPTAENGSFTGYDFQLFRHSNPVLIAQAKSNKITPLGISAGWVKFRVDVRSKSAAGGDGMIVVYYDNGDGNGYNEILSTVDETYSDFTALTFNYETGADWDYYQINVGEITVKQLNTVPVIPSIYSQPEDLSVLPGTSATFSLSAIGATPLTYQWYRNGTPIAGANQSSYTLTPVVLADAGSKFQCKIANNYGSVYSRFATLTISDINPPKTTATLSPTPNNAGWNNSNVTLTLAATDPMPGSGVKSIKYSSTGANVVSLQTIQSSSVAIALKNEGKTIITYFTEDNAGNVETAKTIMVSIDKTPPAVLFSPLNPKPDNDGWNTTTVKIPFIVTDAYSGVFSVSPTSPLIFDTIGFKQTASITVTDSAGNTAYFTSPEVTMVSNLFLRMKDNGFSENNITKPQLYLKNTGSTAISGFKVRLWFSRQEYPYRQITVDRYYTNPSGIAISLAIHPQNDNVFYVDIQYPMSYSLAAGDSTSVDGVQFGVHFSNYYPGAWIKTNDWSWQGMGATFSVTRYLTVYDKNNKLIYGKEPDISLVPKPDVITTGDVFGFEKANAWKISQGTASQSSYPKTQGLASLKISGGGYQEIVSADLITRSISGSTSLLTFDLFIGSTQPNPYWIGQVQLFANCATAGVYNAYIGQQELTNKPIGGFSTITMNIPASVLAALKGNYTDFSFKIVINTNSSSGPYWIDRMQFVNQ